MSHRALTGFLITSIAINLLLVGLIIGHVTRPDGGRQMPLAWAFKEVSPEIREKVTPIIRPRAGEMLAERRKLRLQERELRRLIASKSLTREELEVALANMRVATDRFHEKLHGIGVDVLLALNSSERMEAAPFLFRPPHQGRKPTRKPSETRMEDR